jgi:hypothetical protein
MLLRYESREPPRSLVGHSRPMRSKPCEDVCPLLPESGQIPDRLGMSASCHKRTNAVQQIRIGLTAFFVVFG